MANEQNLRPSEYKLSREEAKKGGINSGKTRKAKADLRKAVQGILSESFTDKNGKAATGQELFIHSLIANLANPGSRNWSKAAEMVVELTGAKMAPEMKERIKAETEMIKAKTEAMKGTDPKEIDDDGFLDAISGTAAADWGDSTE